jgi:SpoIID/LytB domain protein
MSASTARPLARLATLALAAALALGAVPAAAAAGAPAPASGPAPAAATAPVAGGVVAAAGDTLTFTGRGWGHGRGMGQYGALGYAVDHGWSSAQILNHFYGGTTAGNAGNRQITVELTGQTGRGLVVIARDLWVNGQRLGAASLSATVQADGSVALFRGTTCADARTPVAGSFRAGAVEIGTGSQSSFDQLVRVCEASGERAYRGSLTVQRVNGNQMTFNRVASEDYLRGVVPRESPAGWGALGGGRGMQALQAQAVAARSYALSGTRPSGATTCDTTACQVYSGAAFQPWSQPQTILDATATNQAIDATAGVVRLMPSGAIARTEFSSSTGGHTAGGTFTAVPDAGDATASNPNKTWTASIPLATASSALGVGTIRSIAVTQRNGLGADGGRVLGVTVTGTGGTKTMTGNQVRSALGLKSDWFSISWASPNEAASVVTALYADLLGRGPDATGLSTWTNALLQGRSQSELVATLTRSDEYIAIRVRQAYREVLGREPEPAGAQSWLVSIRAAGGATVDDVQRRFYGSEEYFVVSGGNDTGYVQRLYRTMLGREASAADLAVWVPRMGSAAGRETVVNGIWFSMEAAQRRAGAYYRVFLQREPDGPGVLNWGTVLLQHGEGAVRTGIAGSQEYRDRALVRYP